MSKITWLHLSDWHHGREDFDREVVLDALLRDIQERNQIAPELSTIDFIAFSGDIAWSGKSQEYEGVEKHFFEPILENAGLAKDGLKRLFVVPGNHDIDRDQLKSVPSEIITSLVNRESVNEFLKPHWKRDALLSPFAAYSKFASKCSGTDTEKICSDPAYYCVSRIEIGGKTIGIIGLNSAWLTSRTLDSKNQINDYGYLIMGERQVYAALEDIKKLGNTDLNIAIMHHPFHWLTDFDRDLVEERLYRKCHLILHGHEHRPRVNIQRSTLGDVVIVPAGASYDRRRALDSRYTNAYNLVQLDFDKQQGTVYLRRWSDQQGQWVADTELWQEGRFSFSMPKSKDWLNAETREARQGLISKFTPYLRRRFCNKMEVAIRHYSEVHGEIELVKQKIDFKYELAAGRRDTFKLHTYVNSRVAKLVSLGKLTVKPYELTSFKVNGEDVTPVNEPDGNILCNVELDEKEVTIVYGFTSFEMPDGVYRLQLGRFTKYFKLSFQKDKNLEYGSAPMGGFPPLEPAPHPIFDIEEIVTSDLCYPHQGYLFQWYSPINDVSSDEDSTTQIVK